MINHGSSLHMLGVASMSEGKCWYFLTKRGEEHGSLFHQREGKRKKLGDTRHLECLEICSCFSSSSLLFLFFISIPILSCIAFLLQYID